MRRILLHCTFAKPHARLSARLVDSRIREGYAMQATYGVTPTHAVWWERIGKSIYYSVTRLDPIHGNRLVESGTASTEIGLGDKIAAAKARPPILGPLK